MRPPESAFVEALARQFPGSRTEVQLAYGRADVVTPTDVFEVEPLRTWRSGAMQALGYAAMAGKRPNLAVYSLWGVPQFVALALYREVSDGPGGLGLWAWADGLWVPVTSEPTMGWFYAPPGVNQIAVA